ncbi:phosphoribosylglycinamide formyltransferase [Alphaproteobacteria bacterium]|nr:phosphoribosylglycinamide formyltransferase [Alphaproteobacteria bacterium]
MVEKIAIGVLISGRGSNLQALLDAASAPSFPARVALVLSNKADAGGLAQAEKAGVETLVLDHRAFPDRTSFDAEMTRALEEKSVSLVCLAGFMRLLSEEFVTRWQGRLINIHPSLLPLFKGLYPHRQALQAGVKLHGCTVHFVTPEIDDGPIIAQAPVPVLEGDDEDSLASRVLLEEHRLYPLAVRLIAEGRTRIEGRTVHIERSAAP